MRWAVILLLGGCDVVFGIEPHRVVEVDVVRRTVANDAMGVPVAEDTPIARDTIEVRVFDADGNVLETRGSGARFEFVSDGPYRFIVTDPEAIETAEYQGNTPHMRVVRQAVGRTGFERGQDSAELVVDLTSTPPPATGVMRIYTTGVFTLQIPPLPNQLFTVPWRGVPLVDTTQNDRLYVAHFTAQLLATGETVAVTDGLATPPVTMTPTGTSRAVGTYRALARSNCGRLVVPRRTEFDRVVAAWGRPTQINVSRWQIGAWTPRANAAGYVPLVGNEADPAMYADGDFTVMYGDELPHPDRVAMMQIQAYTPLVSRGIQIATGVESRRFVKLAAGCAPTDLSQPIAIADTITVGGVALVEDDQRIRIERGSSIPIAFTFGEGELGAYTVRLYKVVPSTTAPLQPGISIFTNEPRILLDEQELDTGATYTVLVFNVLGVEGAAAGDFAVDGYGSSSTRFSRTFTIEN